MNKPVAWMLKTGHGTKILEVKPYCEVDLWVPLYTHPAELTDEEIIKTMVQFDVYSNDDQCLIEAGRAILRKASE